MVNRTFAERIECANLYSITKYGYPPPARDTLAHIDEMVALGFSSIELEGIREDHLLEIYSMKESIAEKLKKENLTVPYFCGVLPGLSSLVEKERTKQLQLFEKACEVAACFGAIGVLDNAPLPPFHFPSAISVALL
jgi:sugar phosphate isomerase/epimerase